MPRRNTRLICDPQDNCRTIPANPKTDPANELFCLIAMQVRGIALSPKQGTRLSFLTTSAGQGEINAIRRKAAEFWARVDLADSLDSAAKNLAYELDRHSQVSLAAAKRCISAQAHVDECQAAAQSVAALEKQFPSLFHEETK